MPFHMAKQENKKGRNVIPPSITTFTAKLHRRGFALFVFCIIIVIIIYGRRSCS